MHISTIILFLVLLTSFVLSITIDAYYKTFTFSSVFGYAFGLIAYYLILLDQECVHNGPCNIWGWTRLILVVFVFSLLIADKVTQVRKLQKPPINNTSNSKPTHTK